MCEFKVASTPSGPRLVGPAEAERDARERTAVEGMALVLVLIFTILLYVLTAELVTTARLARLTGENDALLARMRVHMQYTLTQAEEMLLDDVQSGEGEGPAGGMAGLVGAAASGGGAEGAAPGGGEDPAANADSSQDAWFEPTGYADDDLTTYVWIEDENRKFNLLTLASPDPEFARESRERFVRLIDYLRDETEFDLSRSDGDRLARNILDWLESQKRTEDLPRPPLKSDDEERRELSAPLQLEDLLMVEGVTRDLFYDKVIDGRVVLGLESVLTVYTSLAFDPGDPEQNANPNPVPNGAPAAGGAASGASSPPGAAGPAAAPAPQGVGVRINLNTAPRPVLRCLFSEYEIPRTTIEAILRYRNEEEEVEENEGGEASGLSDYVPGERPKRKIFTSVEDLEQIREFANLPDPEVKARFLALVTVKSDVFTIHMASLYKRNEERRDFVMRRARSVVVRLENDDEGSLYPIVLLEERPDALRVMPVDFYEDETRDLMRLGEMDQFTREERAWDPFLVDFYKVDWRRGEVR